MANNGYGQFFKAARQAKRGASDIPHAGRTVRTKSQGRVTGPKVDDVLNTIRKRRVRRSLPILPIVSAIILLFGSIFAFHNVEAIEKFIEKVEVHGFGLAKAEDKSSSGKEKSSTTNGESEAKSASEKSPEGKSTNSGNKDWTTEQLALFNKLEERKQQLDVKEKELQRLEEELQEQKLALEKRLRDLEDLRSKISNRLDEKVKVDQEKVDKLVEFYSNMKPVNAAKVFEDIDEDLAVEILNKMKKKSAADIMNLLKSDKAQKLSEKFAGYKRR